MNYFISYSSLREFNTHCSYQIYQILYYVCVESVQTNFRQPHPIQFYNGILQINTVSAIISEASGSEPAQSVEGNRFGF